MNVERAGAAVDFAGYYAIQLHRRHCVMLDKILVNTVNVKVEADRPTVRGRRAGNAPQKVDVLPSVVRRLRSTGRGVVAGQYRRPMFLESVGTSSPPPRE
jgi:hypothetical protein